MTPQPRSHELGRQVPREGESMYPGSRARADYVIDHATGCWEWQKAKNPRGYPTNRQHRRYYELAYGVDITGLDVHHTCHNTSCVNPAHLEAVHHSVHRSTHKRARSLLTEEQVAEIRTLVGMTAKEVALKYGCGVSTIQNIRAGINWKGVGLERPIVHCPNCGEQVTEGNRNRRYCSRQCQANYNARLRRKAA